MFHQTLHLKKNLFIPDRQNFSKTIIKKRKWKQNKRQGRPTRWRVEALRSEVGSQVGVVKPHVVGTVE